MRRDSVVKLMCLILGLAIQTLCLPACGGGGDDNDDQNPPGLNLTGSWTVTMTVRADTCYSYPPGTQLSDNWRIDHNGESITITDGEGDYYQGTIHDRTFQATYNGSEHDGDCETVTVAVIAGSVDPANDNLIKGNLVGTVYVNDPEACGHDNCMTQAEINAGR